MYRVLMLCANNSLLSPMAEGYFRLFSKSDAEVYSAGLEVRNSDTVMLKVLKDDGVDISKLKSCSISELKHIDFDYIITFDEESEQASHHLPSKSVKYHYQFDHFLDPDALENKEELFLNIRNRIKKIIRNFIKEHFTNENTDQ
jgi:arsenate reductase (thioredoxin)